MLRSLPCLFIVTLVLSGCSDPGPPCDVLAERLCAVGDEAFCSVVTQQAEEKRADEKKQDECRAVLEDTTKLREVLDGVKAATRFQLEAKQPPEPKKPKKAKKAKEAKKVKEARPRAKAAPATATPPKAAAPAAPPSAVKPSSPANAR